MAAGPSSADYHIQQIKKLDAEAARLNGLLKQLRLQKKEHQRRIHEYMSRRNLTEYRGIKIRTVTPKPPVKRRPKKERDRAAIEICRATGIPDPENFIKQFKAAQAASSTGSYPTTTPNLNGGYRV